MGRANTYAKWSPATTTIASRCCPALSPTAPPGAEQARSARDGLLRPLCAVSTVPDSTARCARRSRMRAPASHHNGLRHLEKRPPWEASAGRAICLVASAARQQSSNRWHGGECTRPRCRCRPRATPRGARSPRRRAALPGDAPMRVQWPARTAERMPDVRCVEACALLPRRCSPRDRSAKRVASVRPQRRRQRQRPTLHWSAHRAARRGLSGFGYPRKALAPSPGLRTSRPHPLRRGRLPKRDSAPTLLAATMATAAAARSRRSRLHRPRPPTI